MKTYNGVLCYRAFRIGTVITVSSPFPWKEQKANGADISGEDINALRTDLMGPMAGIGDTVSQAVVYPILAGICCSLALDGNFAGPILFEVVYKVLMIGCGYTCFMLGYKQGKQAIFKLLQSGTLNKITEAFSIIGLTVVENMAYSRINVICPAKFRVGEVKIVVQDIFNQLLPGAIPLIIALFVWWMVKKKMNPTLIIAVIFVIGIAASLLGLLSVAAKVRIVQYTG
ncbi:MAG: PTS system mannose/fructose/sorbose family transporter subunit IID [[Clostridium] innocuum]